MKHATTRLAEIRANDARALASGYVLAHEETIRFLLRLLDAAARPHGELRYDPVTQQTELVTRAQFHRLVAELTRARAALREGLALANACEPSEGDPDY